MNVATKILHNDPSSLAFVDVEDQSHSILYRDFGGLVEEVAGDGRSDRASAISPNCADYAERK
jgi:hypothetical protein